MKSKKTQKTVKHYLSAIKWLLYTLSILLLIGAQCEERIRLFFNPKTKPIIKIREKKTSLSPLKSNYHMSSEKESDPMEALRLYHEHMSTIEKNENGMDDSDDSEDGVFNSFEAFFKFTEEEHSLPMTVLTISLEDHPEYLRYFPSEKYLAVNLVTQKSYIQSGIKKEMMFAEVRPPADYKCHACLPLLAGAIYEYHGNEWWLAAQNKTIAYAGQWGTTPQEIAFIHLGGDGCPYGLILYGWTAAQGPGVTYMLILAQIGNSIEVVLDKIVTNFMCECYSEKLLDTEEVFCDVCRSILKILPSKTLGYKDLIVTKLSKVHDSTTTKTKKKTEAYYFNGCVYNNIKLNLSGPFTLQVGAFKELDSACHLVKDLTESEFPAYMVTYSDDDNTVWYRVRISSFFDKTEGPNRVISRLKNDKIPHFWVQNKTGN